MSSTGSNTLPPHDLPHRAFQIRWARRVMPAVLQQHIMRHDDGLSTTMTYLSSTLCGMLSHTPPPGDARGDGSRLGKIAGISEDAPASRAIL